jgi:D-glycero-alpha-D-manno-heptose-7-phosphate kinase
MLDRSRTARAKFSLSDWHRQLSYPAELYRARAPLRLGFAGGGTDLAVYADVHGGAVLNATIDQYAHATLKIHDGASVSFLSRDTRTTLELPSDPDAHDPRGELALHQAVYRKICQRYNGGKPLPCELTTYCEAPPGSGLGSSSTLVVAMIKVFAEALRLPIGDYDMAQLAFEIERRDAGLQGGAQDQYAATFGGFNFMEFGPGERVIVNPLRVKNWVISELESSLVLFFSGRSRSSAAIIAEQARNIDSAAAPKEAAVDAMHRLKADAYEMKEALLRGEMSRFAAILNRSWQAKKSTAAAISNAAIEHVMDEAFAAGAIAGKVSGAGGGGFITFIVDPARRLDVIDRLNQEDGHVFPCSFTRRGTEGWRID